MPIRTSNALLFVAVACIILSLMANLRAGADVFKALEAWISAFFLLTMVTNVFCSGKFHILVKSKIRQVVSYLYGHRGDCLEDFRHQKSSSKLDDRLASRTSHRREQHTVRFERHRGAHNILE
jgi:uncharacterized membrane protein YbhN (UPF0104 family)